MIRIGFAFWLAHARSGVELYAIADAFAFSPEFIARYGALDDRGFVAQVYRNVLGREPEPEGWDYWTAELSSLRLSRGQVLLGFAGSAEHVETSAAAVTWCIMNPDWNPGSDARNGGSSLNAGSMSDCVRRSLIDARSATAIASRSSAAATGAPWKFPPETIRPSAGSSTTEGAVFSMRCRRVWPRRLASTS